MAARIGKAQVKTTVTGRIKLEPAKPRASASQRIGAEKKAKRQVEAVKKAAPGRVTVKKRKRS